MSERQIPAGVIPYLSLQGESNAAVEFYERAFGAKIVMRVPAEGDPQRLVHCHVEINGGPLMMTDFHPDPEHQFQPALSYSMHLNVDDPDSWWARATEAGCEVVTPIQRMSFGALYGRVRDPFGVRWAITGAS
jgi:PhnB protein